MAKSERPNAVLIAGPTASGKSALALDLAQRFGGEIVNADSMQIYDALRILTARPSQADEAIVPHHLYGTVPVDEIRSVAQWLGDVRRVLANLRSRNCIPVIVGGTGLYFRALENGLANVPDIAPAIRASIRDTLRNEGAAFLHKQLAMLDPSGAQALRPTDGQRIARALEVIKQTGRPLSEFQSQTGSHSILPDEPITRILVMPERSILHDRINARSAMMVDNGAVDEVADLLRRELPADATAMKAIGVPQIAAYLHGQSTKAEMLERLRAATRQYAKRQSTWFRRQLGSGWHLVNEASL